MSGDEMLGVMGLPVTKTLAEYAGVPPVDVSMLTASQKARTCSFFVPIKSKISAWEVTMAGNGMDVPSVGFVLLSVGLARVATSIVSINVII